LYHEKAAGEAYISELEQAMYVFSLERLYLVELFSLQLIRVVGGKALLKKHDFLTQIWFISCAL